MISDSSPMALNDKTIHEVKTILERPVLLGTYSWSTSSTPIPIQMKLTDYDADTRNYLQRWDFPQAIFQASANAVEKLARYQYFRSDIEIEVKWNANQFLQGALMMVYNPYYDNVQDFRRKGTRFLASQTSCPYKVQSLEFGDSFKLVCPYANIYDLFDLANNDNQFGTVFLYVFSPLRGTETEENVSFSVFARFVNPTFYTATHIDTMSAHRDSHAIKRLEGRGYRVAQADVAPVSAPDTGEAAATGPISKVATGVTMVTDVLSNVPLIGKVAASVGWVARAVRNTAVTLGWSKPTMITQQEKRVIKPNSTMIHTEGADDSTTLGLIQDNGIDGSEMIPERVDEMALSHVLSRPNFFHAITVPTANFTPGALLTSFEVSPLSQYQYGELEDSQTLFLGSFAYASQAFATLWRGTIHYDLMVIKTQYHKGRFVAVFLPETNIADVPTELGDLNNTNYNVICDLSGGAANDDARGTYRVSVPFISNTPWRETYRRTDNVTNPGPDATTLDTKTGCVAIYALTGLSHPPSVSANVTFYVAHSAGNDYELARPVMNLAPGFQSRYAQSDVGPVVIPESENLLVPTHSSRDVTAQTTGEYFKSLRALAKRFNVFTQLAQTSNFVCMRTRAFAEDNTNGYRVFSRGSFDERVAPTSWYMISFLYRFYNGSSMMKVLPSGPNVSAFSYLKFDENQVGYTEVSNVDAIGQPVFAQLQNISNSYEIRTPFYRGIRCDVVNSNATPILGDVRTCVSVYDRTTTDQQEPSLLFEAAGDDFSYFFMIGPPPMCDIKNVQGVATLPLAVTELDFSTITANTLANAEFSFTPFSVPGLPEGRYAIDAPGVSFTLITSEAPGGATNEQLIQLSDCFVTANAFIVPQPPGAYDLVFGDGLDQITAMGQQEVALSPV